VHSFASAPSSRYTQLAAFGRSRALLFRAARSAYSGFTGGPHPLMPAMRTGCRQELQQLEPTDSFFASLRM